MMNPFVEVGCTWGGGGGGGRGTPDKSSSLAGWLGQP